MKIRELLQEAWVRPTQEEEQLIRQYRQEGWLLKDIDELMGKPKGWTNSVVKIYLRDLITKLDTARAITDQDKQAMAAMLKQGKSLQEISRNFGI